MVHDPRLRSGNPCNSVVFGARVVRFGTNRGTEKWTKPIHSRAMDSMSCPGYEKNHVALFSAEAAKKLGVHITRVQVLIREGRLPAMWVGRTYVIDESDLRLVANRTPGRPQLKGRRSKNARNKRKKPK
jgi:excisionase family DNA binding protein